MEQVHLPHRPQLARTRSATRSRSTSRASSIATLAQDYAFGRDGVKAFKEALKKAKIVHEEYLPQNTTDFTAGAQRLIDALKDKPGRKVIWIIWAGAGNPFKIADLDLKRYGIEIATGGNILPAMAAYKHVPRHGRRDLLLLRHSEEPGQRVAGRRALQASSSRRPTSSPPAA